MGRWYSPYHDDYVPQYVLGLYWIVPCVPDEVVVLAARRDLLGYLLYQKLYQTVQGQNPHQSVSLVEQATAGIAKLCLEGCVA